MFTSVFGGFLPSAKIRPMPPRTTAARIIQVYGSSSSPPIGSGVGGGEGEIPITSNELSRLIGFHLF
jgi:hypothetical protein